MIEENIRMFIVMDDEIEIKTHPLFLRDIKHLRREHRSVIEIAEEIAGIIKRMYKRQERCLNVLLTATKPVHLFNAEDVELRLKFDKNGCKNISLMI